MSINSDKVLSWILPFLLTAILGVLAWMAQSINQISVSLAIAVVKIDDHERRLYNLEDWNRRRK